MLLCDARRVVHLHREDPDGVPRRSARCAVVPEAPGLEEGMERGDEGVRETGREAPPGRVDRGRLRGLARPECPSEPAHPSPCTRFASEGRELSAIRKVARVTLTTASQRGHLGVSVLPLTPSRYDSGAPQCGQGPKRACAMLSASSARAGAL